MNLEIIVQELSLFADAHPQINDFGFGESSNITTKDHKYPILWVQPSSASLDGDMMTLSLECYVLDLQKHSDGNFRTIMNETLNIGKDIVTRFFNKDDANWTINEEDVKAEPITSAFDDRVSGWNYSLDIEFRSDINDCLLD